MLRKLQFIAVLVGLTLVGFAFALSKSHAPTVELREGTLTGVHFGDERHQAAFLGVPYAAPPVGNLRWQPPQAPAHWKGTREATSFAAPCPQLPAGWLPYLAGKEDCLYLNIWTPHLSENSKLPVIVYFHGGGNKAGYSQLTPLGPALVRNGVVVVTANYRLGPLGFLAHPWLTEESPHHSSGNYGLLDQIQALHWVRENIAQFGGDPARITLMGQSAGAVDTCLLMASPLARGLFQGAIMESGDCQGTLNEDIRKPLPYNLITTTGEKSGERFAHDLGIEDGPDALSRLRSVPVEQLLNAWKHDPEVSFDAIVDGWIVPEQPAQIFAEGKQMAIPVVVGSNANEATVFGHGVKTVAEYKDYVKHDSGRFAEEELKAFPVHCDADVSAQYLALQDDTFAYGAWSLARAMTRTGQKAYLYSFAFAESGKRADLGAYHGEELYFLSDSFPADWQHSSADRDLGEAMRRYWTNFAKTGNPNSSEWTHWPTFSPQAPQLLTLGRSIYVRPVPPEIESLDHIMREVIADAMKPDTSSPGPRRTAHK